MFLSRLLDPVKTAAREAGAELWRLYQSGDFQQQQKADHAQGDHPGGHGESVVHGGSLGFGGGGGAGPAK